MLKETSCGLVALDRTPVVRPRARRATSASPAKRTPRTCLRASRPSKPAPLPLPPSHAQSYYCIYGEDSNEAPKLPREDLPTTTLPSGPLSTLPIQPNPTIPPRAPQFPCGSLGTVTKDGKMDYLPTYSDVQYYVPDGSEITWFENEYCAMCAVFKSREEDAEMIWNDWSDEGARGNVIIKGGRSYFCLGQ
jgi:hypothetical protein